jgi:TorA maturation chaperone TorD
MLNAIDSAVDLACETIYRFLAAAAADPRRGRWPIVDSPANQVLAGRAADFLRETFADEPIELGFGELAVEHLDLQALFAAAPTLEAAAQDEFERVFGLVTCRECPPYETEFQPNEEPSFRAQQMADIAGFYRGFGLDSTAEDGRPDHLSLELEFAALLLLKERLSDAEADPAAASERASICRDARTAFLRDHLSWWAPSFASALRQRAGWGFYAQLGDAIAAFLPVERHRLGIAPPAMPFRPKVAEADACAGCLGATKP